MDEDRTYLTGEDPASPGENPAPAAQAPFEEPVTEERPALDAVAAEERPALEETAAEENSALGETAIVNAARYRARSLPVAGALLKEEDRGEKQMSLLEE